jgi:hypothetical protein
MRVSGAGRSRRMQVEAIGDRRQAVAIVPWVPPEPSFIAARFSFLDMGAAANNANSAHLLLSQV